MAKYIFVKNELKPHLKEMGDIDNGTRLPEFLRGLDLVNPYIILNGINLETLKLEENHTLSEDDRIVIVNQVKGLDPITIAIIAIVASVAVSYAMITLLAPDKPSIPKSTEQKKAETEFTVNTSQNQARNGESIPECFGNFVRTPDIISTPYRRYDSNNKQFLYMLLCVGVGENTISDVFIEDTNVTEFSSGVIDYRVYKNATAHTGNDLIKDDWNTTFSDTYMRDVVITVKEIDNILLEQADPFDEIQANPSGTLTDLLEFDIQFPNGLTNNNSSTSVTVQFQYRNSSGTLTTVNEVITANTIDPIRKTYSYAVTPDYYKMKAIRVTADSTSTSVRDTVYLDSMKTYLINNDVTGNGAIEYGDLTLMAVKIKATQGISDKGQFKVKVNATRDNISTLKEVMEHVWTTENGGRQAIEGIDLPIMNETYNSVISSRGTVFKTLQSVATSARYNVFPSFNVLTARKDVPQAVRTMLFSEANIKKNSLKVTMSAKDETDYDGVKTIYRNPTTFENEHEVYPSNSAFPQEIPLDGITDQAFALEQAEFLHNQDELRNIKYQFETELDAFVPSLYDRVGISHPVLSKSQSGVIVDYNVTNSTVTLQDRLNDSYTDLRILFRSRLGTPSVLYTVTNINNRILTLDTSVNALPTDLYIGDDEQKTIYQLGETITFIDDIIITEIKPKANNIIAVTAWNYNEAIYP